MMKPEKGQSLVEMAMTMLLLAGLLILVVDGGRSLFSFMAVKGAAEEGAVYGSIHPDEDADDEGIEERVRNSSSSFVDLSDEINVEVEIPAGTRCAGNLLRVNVTYSFDPIMPGVGSFDISASAQSTILRPECS